MMELISTDEHFILHKLQQCEHALWVDRATGAFSIRASWDLARWTGQGGLVARWPGGPGGLGGQVVRWARWAEARGPDGQVVRLARWAGKPGGQVATGQVGQVGQVGWVASWARWARWPGGSGGRVARWARWPEARGP